MTTAEDDAIGDDYVIAVFTAERSPLSVGSVDRLLARSGALACYVTATENPAVLRAGWHASTLSDAARGALRSLDAAPLTLLSLGTFLTRSATTVVNQLRRDAGGTVADRVRFDDDPVLDALCWFARDYAPLYLSARLERGGNVEVLVWPPGPTHPAVTALSAAVRTDPVLGPACGEDELGVRFRVGPTSPFAYAHQQLVPLEQLGFGA